MYCVGFNFNFNDLVQQYDCKIIFLSKSGIIQINNKQHTIMKIGDTLLNKIESLITEIELPTTQRYFRKNEPIKQKQAQKTKSRINEGLKDRTNTLNVKKSVQKTIHPVKHWNNPETNMLKVTNKTSIFINSHLQLKPIYQRVADIQFKKQEDISRIRQQCPNNKAIMMQQDQQIANQMEERRKNEKKYSPKQLQEKINQFMKRQKVRANKMNNFRMKALKQETTKCTQKPYVREESQQIWKKKKERHHLSTSVFKRFQQYEIDRRQRFQKRMKEINNNVIPFAPKISDNSRILAQRSTSRKSLSRQLERSLSCRCFQRQHSHSLTKNTAHNRSTAHQQTSRKI